MSDIVLLSKHDAARVKNLFTAQIFFMTAFGQLNAKLERFLPPGWRTIGIVASKCFSILTASLTIHLALLFAITALNQLQDGDLLEITDALTMLIIYSFASFGSIYWIIRSQRLEEFFNSVNHGHEHHSLAGLTYISAFRSYDSSRKLTNYWLCLCFCGVVFWALAPLMLGQRALPIKCWYPFDTQQKNVYEILYCVQFVAQCVMGAIFGNGSAVYVSIIIIILGQFDVLFCSLKNIQAHAEVLAGQRIEVLREKQSRICLEQDELNQYLTCQEQLVDLNVYARKLNGPSEKEFQLALQYSIRHCILHHQFILQSCKQLELLFNPYCLVKSLQITVQLCLLLFSGVMSNQSIVSSMNLLGYVSLTFAELIMFTYYGELLRFHSTRAGEALFRSPWHKNMWLIKREVLIFLVNSKKPVQITAGKFFVMNVERLRSVITQAFSFFTLLQKIAAKKL